MKLASVLVHVSDKVMRKISSHEDISSTKLTNRNDYLDNKNRVNKTKN